MNDIFVLLPTGKLLGVSEVLVKQGMELGLMKEIDGKAYGYKHVYRFTKEGWQQYGKTVMKELKK